MSASIPRKLVKDAQWGSVPLMIWERHILDHPIFARLHNVLQNSTAFRVYPSLRTSRYVHSIGVMHVATEMFRAAVIESRSEYLRRKTSGTERTPDGIKTLSDEANSLAASIAEAECKEVARHVRAIFPVRFADGEPASDEMHAALAALRLAALLHDVGHLPGSHIFEFAIEEAAAHRESVLPSIPEKHRQTLASFFDWTQTFPSGKFHEGVGKLIIQVLAEDCGTTKTGIPVAIGDTLRAASFILHATEDKDATLCLHSFVSSLLDADRIDFVRRDTESSGLLRSSVDYGRLLRFMELRAVNLKAGESLTPHLIVMPGERAHSDIEKLLVERFQDYRYIAAHHRVHLGDELLARCIGILLRNDKLHDAINTLVNLSEPDAGGATGKISHRSSDLRTQLNLCTKFDDSWLETQLRDLWFEKAKDHESVALTPREGLLLDAHIQNGSTLESGFHREDDFQLYATKRKTDPNLGWFRKIEQLFAKQKAPAALHELQTAARVVKEGKLKWEQELFDHFGKKLILVGDLGSKLKTGFPPTNRLISDRMEDLIPAAEFLSAKIRRALVFNVWFDRTLDEKKEEIFDEVCKKLTAALARINGKTSTRRKRSTQTATRKKGGDLIAN